MNQTNTPTITQGTKNGRRALGRGLQEILADQAKFGDRFQELPEHVKAARIGAAILELIDIVEAKYQPVIFKSVMAYRAVSQEETTEEIGQKLNELERQRIHREIEIKNPNDDGIFYFCDKKIFIF